MSGFDRRGRSNWGGPLPTVAEVLALDEFKAGEPTVLAGHAGLQARVRWVHISEVPDIASLLSGGELILTTGIALPEVPGGLERYIRDLSSAGAVGVAIELIRRFVTVPLELVRAADGVGLPLIVLQREVPYVAITEAVHSRIVEAQFSELQAGEEAHRLLRALALDSAPLEEIVARMADLAGCPVVVENVSHQPVAFAGAGTAPEVLLANWVLKSRQHASSAEGWEATPLGAGGQVWGRVVILPPSSTTIAQKAVLEGGATALALARLVETNRVPLEKAAQRKLLEDVRAHRLRSMEEFHVRAEALGVPTRHRQLRVIAVHGETSNLAPSISEALLETRTPALVGELVPGIIGVILAVHPGEQADGVVQQVAELLTRHVDAPRVGASMASSPRTLEDLSQAVAESEEAAKAGIAPPGRSYATVKDVRLAGLVKLLADDMRLARFVESQLGSIWDYDQQHSTQLYELLVAYVRSGGNKSVAAQRFHMSRAAFYQNLQRAEQIIGLSLEDPEIRTSFHVAVLAAEATGLGPTTPSGTAGRAGSTGGTKRHRRRST